jgi:cytochrome c biogenesis protein CcmG, thiol:disulfide interchange protein DsbE
MPDRLHGEDPDEAQWRMANGGRQRAFPRRGDLVTRHRSLVTESVMNRYLLPLGIFIALVMLLGFGLSLNPREVPSPLIGKPAPEFSLPQLHQPEQSFSLKDVEGKVWVLNVWASWCAACRDEHPVLTELAESGIAPVYGLNHKDRRDDAIAWLRRYGDPYQASLFDGNGRVGIDYGVYGVPETYVIDKKGIIRYKRIGAVTPEIMKQKIVPLIAELNRK